MGVKSLQKMELCSGSSLSKRILMQHCSGYKELAKNLKADRLGISKKPRGILVPFRPAPVEF